MDKEVNMKAVVGFQTVAVTTSKSCFKSVENNGIVKNITIVI